MENNEVEQTAESGGSTLNGGLGGLDINFILRALQAGENAAFSLSNIYYRQGDTLKEKIWAEERNTIAFAIKQIIELPPNAELRRADCGANNNRDA